MCKLRTILIGFAVLVASTSSICRQARTKGTRTVTVYDHHIMGESIDDFTRISGTQMCATSLLQPGECEKLSQAQAGQNTVITEHLPKWVVYWHFSQRKLVEVTTLTFDPFFENAVNDFARTNGAPDTQTSTYAAWFFDDGGGFTLIRERKRNNFITYRYFSKEKSPHQPVVPRHQGPTTEREETRFAGPNGIFRFDYDKSLVKCTRDSRQSDLWIPAESCAGYIPVCADFSGAGDNTIACVAYAALTMKGTNFQAAAFSVNLVNATTTDACLDVTEASVRTLRTETVNGMTFKVIETPSVAAGNLMDGEAYRSFHENKCYELDIRIASSNIGNYNPGTVRKFDREAVYRSLKSVLNTFEFRKTN